MLLLLLLVLAALLLLFVSLVFGESLTFLLHNLLLLHLLLKKLLLVHLMVRLVVSALEVSAFTLLSLKEDFLFEWIFKFRQDWMHNIRFRILLIIGLRLLTWEACFGCTTRQDLPLIELHVLELQLAHLLNLV